MARLYLYSTLVAVAATINALAGCASHTNSLQIVKPATEPMGELCVLMPIVLDKVSILVRAPGAVTENNKSTAHLKVQDAISTYRQGFQAEVSSRLQPFGTTTNACTEQGSAGRNRLAAYVQGAYVGNTPLGQKTDLHIQVALQQGSTGAWVWRGNFTTGNMVAGPSGPDASSVAAFADSVVVGLRASGWVK